MSFDCRQFHYYSLVCIDEAQVYVIYLDLPQLKTFCFIFTRLAILLCCGSMSDENAFN